VVRRFQRRGGGEVIDRGLVVAGGERVVAEFLEEN
jgi:hypothetical protein